MHPTAAEASSQALSLFLVRAVCFSRSASRPSRRPRPAGPLAHFYYDFVGTLESWPILSKILLDQTAYLAFYNTVYYVALTVLAGKSFGEAVEEYKGSFWLLLTSGWKLWPLVGIVTYTLIPQQNRVLWIDGIEIIYSALLSTLANKEEEEEA